MLHLDIRSSTVIDPYEAAPTSQRNQTSATCHTNEPIVRTRALERMSAQTRALVLCQLVLDDGRPNYCPPPKVPARHDYFVTVTIHW
jgi:hypothetical protein